jgi:hypothetical protein
LQRHTLEYLRGMAHLRPRTNLIGAVTRVRNALSYATHTFFQVARKPRLSLSLLTAAQADVETAACWPAAADFVSRDMLNARRIASRIRLALQGGAPSTCGLPNLTESTPLMAPHVVA